MVDASDPNRWPPSRLGARQAIPRCRSLRHASVRGRSARRPRGARTSRGRSIRQQLLRQWRHRLLHKWQRRLGSFEPNAVTIDHILRILQPIWSTKTETATRLRGRLESILDWTEHRGYRHGKNPAHWGGNLRHELPSPTKLIKRKKQHHPALPYLRVGAFMEDSPFARGDHSPRARMGHSDRRTEPGDSRGAQERNQRAAATMDDSGSTHETREGPCGAVLSGRD